jgi:hypothetical protein
MFRIQVKTIQGTILTFSVENYTIEEGDFVKFFDEKYKEWKQFHSSNCEIKEVKP